MKTKNNSIEKLRKETITSHENENSKNKEFDQYKAWIKVNEWNRKREELLRNLISKLEIEPLFSIVIPVYKPNLQYLKKAIKTIKMQVYENWEICIADDASKSFFIKRYLKKVSKKDSRIKVCFRAKNGHISKATNSAAELAKGEFLVLMDQDDEITPDALAELAIYINNNSDADILYSDDDKIDIEGNRFDPQFKPDWSPELLYSFMYFAHLFCIRKSLYNSVGGMRSGFEGSQDYDLALRSVEKARKIGHIPKILYHWRVLPGSTALCGNEKNYSFTAGINAVQETFERMKISCKVVQQDWASKIGCGFYKPVFPHNGPEVAIIIPTKNQYKVLSRCLNSLSKTLYENYKIYIIDNDSNEQEILDYFKECEHTVINIKSPEGKFNFSYLNNKAVESINEEYVLFLNNDTEVISSEWLSEMVGYLGLKDVKAVGARLLFPDNRIQHAGVLHDMNHGLPGISHRLLPDWHGGYLGMAKVACNYSAVTGACMLVEKEYFKKLGGFNEDKFAVAFNDLDFCYRIINEGYRIVYASGAELYHHEGASRGFGTGNDNPQEEADIILKYKHWKDSYYNPNLFRNLHSHQIAARTLPAEIKKPLKTVIATHNLNFHEGAPRFEYFIVKGLKELRIIDPVIISPADGSLREMYESHGIKVIVLENILYGKIMNDYNNGIKDLMKIFSDESPQLVHANTIICFWAIDAANSLNIPSIWNIHESEPLLFHLQSYDSNAKVAVEKCFHYAYQVVFVSEATRELYMKYRRGNNFLTIYNSFDLEKDNDIIDFNKKSNARKKLGIHDNEILIISIGTVCDRKGQLDIVKAVKQLYSDDIRKIRINIIGAFDYAPQYKDIVFEELNLLPPEYQERIKIAGKLPEKEKVLYSTAADIYVCCSRIESFPLIIQEAAYFKCAIVTTPVFGIKEQLRDNVSGLFYEPGDAEKLANNLSRVINSKELRKELVENASWEMKRFLDFPTIIKKYEMLFKEAWITR